MRQGASRRTLLSLVAGGAALLAGSNPAEAAFGDSANVFGKATNTSGVELYSGQNAWRQPAAITPRLVSKQSCLHTALPSYTAESRRVAGFIPYAGEGWSLLLPSKWNPSREREFKGVEMRYLSSCSTPQQGCHVVPATRLHLQSGPQALQADCPQAPQAVCPQQPAQDTMLHRYEDNGDAVNNVVVISRKTEKGSVKDFGNVDEFLAANSYLFGEQTFKGNTISEGGFKKNKTSAASILDVQQGQDKKGKDYYKYELLVRSGAYIPLWPMFLPTAWLVAMSWLRSTHDGVWVPVVAHVAGVDDV